MTEQEKTIRFKFEVDDVAAEKAKNLLKTITEDINKLAQSASRAGESTGGILGGVTAKTVGTTPIGVGGGRVDIPTPHKTPTGGIPTVQMGPSGFGGGFSGGTPYSGGPMGGGNLDRHIQSARNLQQEFRKLLDLQLQFEGATRRLGPGSAMAVVGAGGAGFGGFAGFGGGYGAGGRMAALGAAPAQLALPATTGGYGAGSVINMGQTAGGQWTATSYAVGGGGGGVYSGVGAAGGGFYGGQKLFPAPARTPFNWSRALGIGAMVAGGIGMFEPAIYQHAKDQMTNPAVAMGLEGRQINAALSGDITDQLLLQDPGVRERIGNLPGGIWEQRNVVGHLGAGAAGIAFPQMAKHFLQKRAAIYLAGGGSEAVAARMVAGKGLATLAGAGLRGLAGRALMGGAALLGGKAALVAGLGYAAYSGYKAWSDLDTGGAAARAEENYIKGLEEARAQNPMMSVLSRNLMADRQMRMRGAWDLGEGGPMAAFSIGSQYGLGKQESVDLAREMSRFSGAGSVLGGALTGGPSSIRGFAVGGAENSSIPSVGSIIGRSTSPLAGFFGSTSPQAASFSGGTMKTSSKYDAMIRSAAAKEGIPYELLNSLIQTESAFNPNAKSSVGAVGLGQFMPATAKRFGITNRSDPQQSVQGSAKYLKTLLKRYDGNVELAVRAYNAGEGNVDSYFVKSTNTSGEMEFGSGFRGKKENDAYWARIKERSGYTGVAVEPTVGSGIAPPSKRPSPELINRLIEEGREQTQRSLDKIYQQAGQEEASASKARIERLRGLSMTTLMGHASKLKTKGLGTGARNFLGMAGVSIGSYDRSMGELQSVVGQAGALTGVGVGSQVIDPLFEYMSRDLEGSAGRMGDFSGIASVLLGGAQRGSPLSLMDVQSGIRGVEGMNSVLGKGGNPFFQMQNFGAATDILGSNSSYVARRMLSEMSEKELRGFTEDSTLAKGFGVTKAQALQMANRRAMAVVRSGARLGGIGDLIPEGATIKSVMGSLSEMDRNKLYSGIALHTGQKAGDVRSYLQGVAQTGQVPEGLGLSALEGGGRSDQIAQDSVKKMQDAALQVWETEIKARKMMNISINGTKTAFDDLKKQISEFVVFLKNNPVTGDNFARSPSPSTPRKK